MAAELQNNGLCYAELVSDEKGFRVYKTKWKVNTAVTDGPAIAFNCPGLPVPGSAWSFQNDYDPWVWCRLNKTVKPAPNANKDGAPVKQWIVEIEFSNKPIGSGGNQDGGGGCQEEQIDDPLLQEPRVSGSFREEKTDDPNIKSSSHEPFTGPQNEWDDDKPTIEIEQNVAVLELGLLAEMANTVNDAELWGCPARTIKFKPGPWEKKHYGQCYPYYTRKLTFDVNIVLNEDGEQVSGWDRDLLDEGTKCLNGRWASETQTTKATFDVTMNSLGEISAATINSGGTGYPASATFMLSLAMSSSNPDAGHTEIAVLKVSTNASGVVSTVIEVSKAGYGYDINTLTLTADDMSGWILTAVDTAGTMPDPDNPAHFQAFQDRKGNNARTVLAAGVPMTTEAAGKIHAAHYGESNFLLLGIPTDF